MHVRDVLAMIVDRREEPSPLTTVRSTSIGHAVFGTLCIASINGPGSARRDAEFAL